MSLTAVTFTTSVREKLPSSPFPAIPSKPASVTVTVYVAAALVTVGVPVIAPVDELKLNPDARMPRRGAKIPDQCAVVVGGFATIDAARSSLDKVKKLNPPELKVAEGKVNSDVVSLFVPVPGKGVEIRREMVNPFTRSFVTRNPTVPNNTPPPPKYDPFMKKLNSEESYSLLRSNKKWTLLVKEYRGATMVQSTTGATGQAGGFLEKIGFSKNSDTLNACAMQAHETARVLRKLEFEDADPSLNSALGGLTATGCGFASTGAGFFISVMSGIGSTG